MPGMRGKGLDWSLTAKMEAGNHVSSLARACGGGLLVNRLKLERQEWVRWHEKELVLAKQRAQKEQDARVLLKRLGLQFESLTSR